MNLIEKARFGYPNEEQLSKINQLRPAGFSPYESEQVFVVPIAAANNMIGYSGRAWTENSLKRMARDYALTNPDFLESHTDDSEGTIGQVFDAELWTFKDPSKKIIDHILSYSPAPDLDKKILKKEGYHLVVCYAFVEATSETASNLLYKRRTDVSIAGFQLPIFTCPVCSNAANSVTFDNESCPHLMPYGVFWRELIGEDQRKLFAPYYLSDHFKQAVEISVVTDGDCAQAQIITESMIEILLK
jgi:hypothetical protein